MERSDISKIREILSDGQWHKQQDLAATLCNINSSLSGMITKLFAQGYYVERLMDGEDGRHKFWKVRVTLGGAAWDWRVKPSDREVDDTRSRLAEDKRLGRKADVFCRYRHERVDDLDDDIETGEPVRSIPSTIPSMRLPLAAYA